MRTIDFSPIFRSSVGFDRMANLLDTAFLANQASAPPTYPPYNIEKINEDSYRITMAIAGLNQNDIDVTVKENTLTVSGKIGEAEVNRAKSYLHRGIATRAFERRFDLAEHISVKDAMVENGLLYVDLVREIPEDKKPRKIKISTALAKLEKEAA